VRYVCCYVLPPLSQQAAELSDMGALTYDGEGHVKPEEAEGRQSGDAAWIASRGEDGTGGGGGGGGAAMCATGAVPLPEVSTA
jgi:hypothetical protein